MTYHGKLSEFDSTSEDWPSYVERMEQYFAANDVGDETKKRAILYSLSVGPQLTASFEVCLPL